MQIARLCLFCGTLVLIASTSFSQEELTFKKIVTDALRNNITITKSQDAIDAQEFNIKASYNDILPSLTFNSGWTRTKQVLNGSVLLNGIPFTFDNYSKTTNNFNFALRSDITLFNGFNNYEKVNSARLTKTKLVTQMQKAKQDIVFKILGDYITVLKNKQIVVIDSATLHDTRSQLESVKAFVEVGKKTLADIYKQDAVVAQNELALEQAKNTLDKSIADLVFDANIYQNKVYTVAGSEFPIDITYDAMQLYVEKNSNTEFLVSTAIRNRYDYKSLVQNLDVLRLNTDIADNSVIFPTLSGFTSYSLNGDKIWNVTNSRIFTFGLTLSYPIFQGFTVDNQRQQARINYRIGEEDLNQLKNQITVDTKKAVLDLKSLLKQIEIADRSLKSTEQDKINAEESYKVGLVTLLEVNTAETNYNNALINKSNLIYNFLLAQKQLEYLQGIISY